MFDDLYIIILYIFLLNFFNLISMTERQFQRKLTAILSADVKGYSRLMGEDEARTVRTLTEYREVFYTLVRNMRGRVVDSPGDNILAEFPSVVDAVNCAVEIQKELQKRNSELPEDQRMVFRIGINLGDVIQEGDRIYGDGVNIAARIESLADPGGLSISGTAFDQVENKLNYHYEFMGEHRVKNIVKPVRVYRVLWDRKPAGKEIKPAGFVKGALRKKAIASIIIIALVIPGIWYLIKHTDILSKKQNEMSRTVPSIAVLPFLNLNRDAEEKYLGEGITEDLIAGLSRIPHLMVISRNSSFAYKGKSRKPEQIGKELGVRYLLEGSVQTQGDRLRTTVRLIDTRDGHLLFSERYDRKLKDIFALQDEITFNIITALAIKLGEGEQAQLFSKGTKNLDAYIDLIKGREEFYRMNKQGNTNARELFQKAVSLDPDYAVAYRLLGATYQMEVVLGYSKNPKQSIQKAKMLAKKAIELDESEAGAHSLLARLYLMERAYDEAVAEAQKAIQIAPGSADAYASMGVILTFSGQHQKAIKMFQKAMLLNPMPPSWYFHNMGNAQRNEGHYDDAISSYKKAIEIKKDNIFAWLGMASTYSLMGKKQKAEEALSNVYKIYPGYSIEKFKKRMPYKNRDDLLLVLNSLKSIGLK